MLWVYWLRKFNKCKYLKDWTHIITYNLINIVFPERFSKEKYGNSKVTHRKWYSSYYSILPSASWWCKNDCSLLFIMDFGVLYCACSSSPIEASTSINFNEGWAWCQKQTDIICSRFDSFNIFIIYLLQNARILWWCKHTIW